MSVAAKDKPKPSLDFPYPQLAVGVHNPRQWIADMEQAHRQWVTRLTNRVTIIEERLAALENP